LDWRREGGGRGDGGFNYVFFKVMLFWLLNQGIKTFSGKKKKELISKEGGGGGRSRQEGGRIGGEGGYEGMEEGWRREEEGIDEQEPIGEKATLNHHDKNNDE
jgi:hypothetical protein